LCVPSPHPLPQGEWDAIDGGAGQTLQLGTGTLVRGAIRLTSMATGEQLMLQPFLDFGGRRAYQAPLWLDLNPNDGTATFSFDGPNRAPTASEAAAATTRRPERERARKDLRI